MRCRRVRSGMLPCGGLILGIVSRGHGWRGLSGRAGGGLSEKGL